MSSSKTFSFAGFELDVAAYALRRQGQQIRLERRPMDLLILLVERRPELVSRQDIIERLWSPDVVVEVETGINTAMRKVRQVLGDTPDQPKFIETIPGRGYRFIAEVEISRTQTSSESSAVTLAVLPFENIGGQPEQEYLADGFTEEATTALGQIDPERLSVIGRTSVLSYKRTTRSLAEIGRELGVTYVVEGSIRSRRRAIAPPSNITRGRPHSIRSIHWHGPDSRTPSRAVLSMPTPRRSMSVRAPGKLRHTPWPAALRSPRATRRKASSVTGSTGTGPPRKRRTGARSISTRTIPSHIEISASSSARSGGTKRLLPA